MTLAEFNKTHPVYSRSRRRPKGEGHYKWFWTYPVAEPVLIHHAERTCQAVVRKDGKRVKISVTVPAYTQVRKA